MGTTSSTSLRSSSRGWQLRHRTLFTDRAHGDLSVHEPADALTERRRRLVDHPWSWLRQVHGCRVVRVDAPGAWAGEEADAAVTAVPGAVLAVHTADCVPLVVTSGSGIGVAHVGWRGLVAGVVESTVTALRALEDGSPLRAEIGPSIRPRCYEFGPEDLDVVAARYGPSVRSTSARGLPALDLASGISIALERVGVGPPRDGAVCTACSPVHWSFRAGADKGRQASLAWIEP